MFEIFLIKKPYKIVFLTPMWSHGRHVGPIGSYAAPWALAMGHIGSDWGCMGAMAKIVEPAFSLDLNKVSIKKLHGQSYGQDGVIRLTGLTEGPR